MSSRLGHSARLPRRQSPTVRTLSVMTELAQRLLNLTAEYQAIERDHAVADEFARPEWAPRTQAEVAEEYGEVFAQMVRAAAAS